MFSITIGDKLGDEHINAANELLHSQFPDVQGLCTPVLGQRLCFPNFDRTLGYAGFSYIQVLHTGADHWVTIQISSYDDEVNVYDSLVATHPTYHVLKQIAAILHSSAHEINLKLEKVQFQTNSVDCGVYAIAFITDLCHNRDPACFKYASSVQLRRHLLKCFETGIMTPFPSLPSPKNKPVNKKLRVHCSCRLPYILEYMKPQDIPKDEPNEMIQCNICAFWYHHNCVGMTIDEVKKFRKMKEFWMCDYKGCNDAFADNFDLD